MDLNLIRKFESLARRNQWRNAFWIPLITALLVLLGWEALSYFSCLPASRWQVSRYLEILSALPIFLSGLRIGATLSIIGGVLGDLFAADNGLGFLISVARGQYDTALVFVAVFTLVALALTLYGIVILLEKHFLAWQEIKP